MTTEYRPFFLTLHNPETFGPFVITDCDAVTLWLCYCQQFFSSVTTYYYNFFYFLIWANIIRSFVSTRQLNRFREQVNFPLLGRITSCHYWSLVANQTFPRNRNQFVLRKQLPIQFPYSVFLVLMALHHQLTKHKANQL